MATPLVHTASGHPNTLQPKDFARLSVILTEIITIKKTKHKSPFRGCLFLPGSVTLDNSPRQHPISVVKIQLPLILAVAK